MAVEKMTGFPKRLRELRRSKNVSLRVLADFCEVSKSTLARYEQGKQKPTADIIIKLAEFFNVSTDSLLGKK